MDKLFYLIIKILYKPFFLLRKVKLGFGVKIEPRVFISKSIIGDYSYIGHNCVINNTDIGNYCSIAAYVQLGGMEHSHKWLSMSTYLSDLATCERTSIGHDVWIGSKVTIRSGVTIGNGAVIGSNSVVLKNVEPYSIVAGVPAKVIGTRLNNEIIDKLEKSNYYNFKPEQAKKILNNLNYQNES